MFAVCALLLALHRADRKTALSLPGNASWSARPGPTELHMVPSRQTGICSRHNKVNCLESHNETSDYFCISCPWRVVHLHTCLNLEFLFCHQSPNPAVQVTLALKGSRKSAPPQWHHKEDLPRSIFPHSQSHMGAMYDCISPANFTATVQVTGLWDPPQGVKLGCACNLAMCEDSYRLVSCMSREMSKHFAKHSKKI